MKIKYAKFCINFPGTTFQLHQKNLIFKNKLIAKGTENQPIVFRKQGTKIGVQLL